jgi:glycosyltransferase involved in cell wall biosynthesis
VRVLTTFPNYPEGRTHPGYRQRWNERTTMGLVTVRRVPVYPSHDSSAVRRVASYLSFASTSSAAVLRYLAGVDAVYVYSPPPTAFAAAELLRLIRRTPILLHVQDMWPESVTASAMTPGGRVGQALHRGLGAMMGYIYRRSSAIAVIAPSMAELVVDRGADPEKVRVVLNWTDEELFRPVPATAEARAAIGHRGRCTIMFAGNMGRFQRVQTAIRAAAATGQIDLVLVGSGADEEDARRLAKELEATNVRFIGRRPPEQMAELYAAADFQVITLRDLAALRGTVPSKLQAALACGAPVIISASGDAARIVESAEVGFACPAEDWRALTGRFAAAAAMTADAQAAMGRRARMLYQERMSLTVGAGQIEDMLTKIGSQLSGKARRSRSVNRREREAETA